MEMKGISDRLAKDICENIGQTLVNELDKEDVWDRVERSLSEFLKNHNINEDAANLTDKIEWSVRVELKK